MDVGNPYIISPQNSLLHCLSCCGSEMEMSLFIRTTIVMEPIWFPAFFLLNSNLGRKSIQSSSKGFLM